MPYASTHLAASGTFSPAFFDCSDHTEIHSRVVNFVPAGYTRRDTRCNRQYEIALPHMANSGLSENWLLKEMGDMHWSMLSKGLGKPTTELTDNAGNRVYAAFVRIRYSVSPLGLFRENAPLSLSGAISRHGCCNYFSTIQGRSNSNIIRAELATSFSRRQENNNQKFSNHKPKLFENNINELSQSPDFFTEFRQLKKNALQTLETGGYTFSIGDIALHEYLHTINPYYEINGAGLLYFASYPLIADLALSAFHIPHANGKDNTIQYDTVFRDVCYFANCNPSDKLRVELNSIKLISGKELQISASIYRHSDNVLMARVFTVKNPRLDYTGAHL